MRVEHRDWIQTLQMNGLDKNGEQLVDVPGELILVTEKVSDNVIENRKINRKVESYWFTIRHGEL